MDWWYQQPCSWKSYWLLPLSLLYRFAILLRRSCYHFKIFRTYRAKIPVIVVGNISVGGTGKTPLVIALAIWLNKQGYKPGIVSRGYGGKAEVYPCDVLAASDPDLVGDEPVLMARKSSLPVVVDPKRPRAIEYLVQHYGCDIVISDDGLQHLAMHRDIEIAVIDGERLHGNGFCLPAGPLREPVSRLKSVDFVLANVTQSKDPENHNWSFELNPAPIESICDPDLPWPTKYAGRTIDAVAGIGYPERFFQSLCEMDFVVIPHVFPDHCQYCFSDIDFGPESLVIMTEKDAVKCQSFADWRHWVLPVEVILPPAFQAALLASLKVA